MADGHELPNPGLGLPLEQVDGIAPTRVGIPRGVRFEGDVRARGLAPRGARVRRRGLGVHVVGSWVCDSRWHGGDRTSVGAT